MEDGENKVKVKIESEIKLFSRLLFFKKVSKF
jgi:hypothetical protein